MKQLSLFAVLVLATAKPVFSQHTFSIVAVDTLTGEVGSAGASCLDDNSFPGSGGAIIISDLLPGIGAIHTQSYYLAENQQNARTRMEAGDTPTQIIDWLKVNDFQGNAAIRQYGVVVLNVPAGGARSAAFTGASCLNYKNHRTGATYAIQGNILLGKRVLDSMELRFKNATGTLADRLMACLQGANMVGADSRCTPNNTSSLSAFLRVAKPTDTDGHLYLDLNVPSLPAMTEPIDSLQTLYDQWKLTATETPNAVFEAAISPNPASGQLTLSILGDADRVEFLNLLGQKVFESQLIAGQNLLVPKILPGVYWLKISGRGRTWALRQLFWE